MSAKRFEDIDRPANLPEPVTGWGSDVLARLLAVLDFKYIALVPGASYRGLHDSLVNYLGNTNPQMLVCLHEEHAVAIAQGYAKVTDRPMLACLHSNVGLMHASMAIYNAWCDRMPMVILGATGPTDANERRPWIDWIHTSKDQGALVRNFVKWDDQPGSIPAAVESILRARQITLTAPYGPTYICLDAELQEDRLQEPIALPDLARFQPAQAPAASAAQIEQAADWLAKAERPVVLCGRVSRSQADWDARIALCESIGGVVLTDTKNSAAFPSEHPLHVLEPRHRPGEGTFEALNKADVILALDWLDLAGLIKTAQNKEPVTAKIISVSVDSYVHNGWSMDHQGLPAVDLPILATPDAINEPLRVAIDRITGGRRYREPKLKLETKRPSISYLAGERRTDAAPIEMRDLAECVSVTLRCSTRCLAPSSSRSRDIRAETTSCSRSSAARSRAAAIGRGRRSSARAPNGSATGRSTSSSSSPTRSIRNCSTSP